MAKVKVNLTALNRILRQSLEDTVDELDVGFKDAFEDPIYQWPRTTLRSNGQVVGSPRDIVDTGALRDSQDWRMVSADEAEFSWGDSTVDYALEVHEGVGRAKPARRWTEYAIRQRPPIVVFAAAIRRRNK